MSSRQAPSQFCSIQLFFHAHPFAVIIFRFGKFLSFFQRHLLGIFDAHHCVMFFSSFNIHPIVRGAIPFHKLRSLTQIIHSPLEMLDLIVRKSRLDYSIPNLVLSPCRSHADLDAGRKTLPAFVAIFDKMIGLLSYVKSISSLRKKRSAIEEKRTALSEAVESSQLPAKRQPRNVTRCLLERSNVLVNHF